MKLASIELSAASGDAGLVVVSSDHTRGALVPTSVAPSLLGAIEKWSSGVEGALRELGDSLENGSINPSEVLDLSSVKFKAPLARTFSFLDGSAFLEHVALARKARGADLPEHLETVPLMYQGLSDTFLGPTDDIPLIDPAHGLDFEGEFAVVLSEVPMGTKSEAAEQYILLLLMINDISLRNIIREELKSGFGFLQGKPASSFAPYAVTPDELGSAWSKARVCLDLECSLNGELIGRPNGAEMHFSFCDLIEHAARTRTLSAGTIIGSGTVSNRDETRGSSCIVEKRMREKIRSGEIESEYLRVGDRLVLESKLEGKTVFGAIEQKVTGPSTPSKKET